MGAVIQGQLELIEENTYENSPQEGGGVVTQAKLKGELDLTIGGSYPVYSGKVIITENDNNVMNSSVHEGFGTIKNMYLTNIKDAQGDDTTMEFMLNDVNITGYPSTLSAIVLNPEDMNSVYIVDCKLTVK